MTTQLAPTPVFKAWDNQGIPLAGGKLFTYLAGSTTKQASFTDSTGGTPNTNPVILNYRGEANIWLDPTKVYKLVLAPSTDTDPPTNPIWTVDQISGGQLTPSGSIIPTVNNTFNLGSPSFSWANAYFGANGLALLDANGNAGFYARTSAEIAASVTPTDYFYSEGDLRRYGGDPTGAADASTAWQAAINVGIARIPRGCSFKVLTQATKTGQVTILGEGPTSKLLCDANVMTITSGNGSFVDNFRMENITAPYIITRNPANWAAVLTPAQSNGLGYQPTTNDPEYATWVAGQPLVGTQNIGPTINFTGAATDITVSRIFGRFVRINMLDTIYSTIRDCDFQGGRGTFGAILWDNCSNNIQRGVNNKSINNRIYYASFSGIASIANDDFVYQGNQCFSGGESGTKTLQTSGFILTGSPSGLTSATLTAPFTGPTASDYGIFFDNGEVRQNVTLTNGSTAVSWSPSIAAGAGTQIAAWGHSSLFNNSTIAPFCLRGQIVGNRTYWNYYDGLDCDSTFGITNGAVRTYHQVCDNYSYQNRGDGMNTDGQFNNISGNTFYSNGAYGIWGVCQNSKIVDNMCIDNNQNRSTLVAEILATGGPGNKIADNYIYGGPTQNCPGIVVTQASINYIMDNIGVGVSTNNVGNVGLIASVYDNNNDSTVGAATEQSFLFKLINNGGTLQHIFYADLSAQGPGKFDRVIGATSGGFTTTPTGTDSSTAFAAGAKIGSAITNALWFNTAAQPITTVRMIAAVVANSTGTALTVVPMIQAININGVSAQRLTYQLVNAATGAGFSLNTTNITAGKEIDIQFYGKLS
jgi:hypothetical protein